MDGIELNPLTLNLPIQAAAHLKERYERLMEAISSVHSGDICDEAKALLECVFRTIINNRNGNVVEAPSGRATFISLYEQAWDTLQVNGPSEEFKLILKRAVQDIGNIRNDYGGVSHGQDGYDERSLGLTEALYIARSALSLAGYMYTHHLNVSQDTNNVRINYEDNPEFNEYIDSNDEVVVAGIVMVASEVLFSNDLIAYKERLIEYKDSMIDAQVEAYFELQSDIERGK